MADVEALRATMKWSQSHMAEYLGCHQSTIHRIAAGQPQPGPISRILERLEVLVAEGVALPGMPPSVVIDLAIGRLPPNDRVTREPSYSLEPQSA